MGCDAQQAHVFSAQVMSVLVVEKRPAPLSAHRL